MGIEQDLEAISRRADEEKRKAEETKKKLDDVARMNAENKQREEGSTVGYF